MVSYSYFVRLRGDAFVCPLAKPMNADYDTKVYKDQTTLDLLKEIL